MNRITLAMNRRTCPKRCVSQPVSGTAMALATAKLVMTQVPCVVLTPRSPEMAGSDTFAIDVSSTFMKVAADSAIVPQTRAAPSSGGCATWWSSGGHGDRANCLPELPEGSAGDQPGCACTATDAAAGALDGAAEPFDGAVAVAGALRPRLAATMRSTSASAPRSSWLYTCRLRQRGGARRVGQHLAALVDDVDLGVHRQAHAQRVGLELLGVERDAHRHALHHLDPVAGGVLRRQQRERARRCRRPGPPPCRCTRPSCRTRRP